MNEFHTICLDCDDRGVAQLTLSRPEKHNALNAQMITELRSATAKLGNDDRVRAVILAAQGASFCAGGDLGWMADQVRYDRGKKIAESMELAKMLRDLDTLSKPLIGRVQGNAYGGGIGLMAVCDIVVAVETAEFALTETRLGLIPATIGPYVVRRLGEGKARRVFMNGKVFDASAGCALGLISEVAIGEKLNEIVEAEVAWFLRSAPGAVADAKSLCLDLSRNIHGDIQSWTANKLADRWETEEAQEGIRNFLARKKAS